MSLRAAVLLQVRPHTLRPGCTWYFFTVTEAQEKQCEEGGAYFGSQVHCGWPVGRQVCYSGRDQTVDLLAAGSRGLEWRVGCSHAR